MKPSRFLSRLIRSRHVYSGVAAASALESTVVPVPFQIAMIAAGLSGYSLAGFITATMLSRSIRYFGLGFLVWRYGDKAKEVYEKHKKPVVVASTGIILFFWIVFWVLF